MTQEPPSTIRARRLRERRSRTLFRANDTGDGAFRIHHHGPLHRGSRTTAQGPRPTFPQIVNPKFLQQYYPPTQRKKFYRD